MLCNRTWSGDVVFGINVEGSAVKECMESVESEEGLQNQAMVDSSYCCLHNRWRLPNLARARAHFACKT